MGVFRLMIKSSELRDIAAFPGAQAKSRWQKVAEIPGSSPRDFGFRAPYQNKGRIGG